MQKAYKQRKPSYKTGLSEVYCVTQEAKGFASGGIIIVLVFILQMEKQTIGGLDSTASAMILGGQEIEMRPWLSLNKGDIMLRQNVYLTMEMFNFGGEAISSFQITSTRN